jgi:outer membrane protein TolC
MPARICVAAYSRRRFRGWTTGRKHALTFCIGALIGKASRVIAFYPDPSDPGAPVPPVNYRSVIGPRVSLRPAQPLLNQSKSAEPMTDHTQERTMKSSAKRPLDQRAIPLRRALVVCCTMLLTGCRTFSPDGGMGEVTAIVGGNLNKDIVKVSSPGDEILARDAVERLLRKPLTADAAVQIALLNNRGLQAAYNELGIAEAVCVANSRPPAPSFSFSYVSTALELDVERQIVASILALVTQPARTEIAADRFAQAQLQAALETLRVAAEARRAYYRAVAAQEIVSALTGFKSTAESSAELAKKLGETGALNELDQARQQVFYADVTTELAAARQQATIEREHLVRALGLWGYDLDFKLPAALPALPAKPKTRPTIEQDALDHRVDLQIARIEVEALARSYGLTRATRFINVLDASGISKTQKDKGSGEPHSNGGGFDVAFEVPIFDFGRPRLREAEQRYMQAVNLVAEGAINARSEAREAYRTYRSSYEISGHYQREVIPLRRTALDQAQLQFNSMLIDVFALVTEARQLITATVNGIESKRDFWLANTDLSVAVLGGGGLGSNGDSFLAAKAALAGQ